VIGDDERRLLEEAWRSPSGKRDRGGKAALVAVAALAGSRRSSPPGTGGGGRSSARAKLERLTHHAPEVMVKVTGRQRGGDHTAAHLDYIGRHGKLEVETSEGDLIHSRQGLQALADEWGEQEAQTSRRREPLTSVSMILSMPPGSDPEGVYQSARAIAHAELDAFGWAMALHTDTDHPHVHLTVAARGEDGLRFNPRKDDLVRFREAFARELRARGIEAEATPRRARGIVRKPETTAVRKIRERAENGSAPPPRVLEEGRRTSAALANERPPDARPWEVAIVTTQARIRAAYRKVADRLAQSADPGDRALAAGTRSFVETMAEPATRDRAGAFPAAQGQISRSPQVRPSRAIRRSDDPEIER